MKPPFKSLVVTSLRTTILFAAVAISAHAQNLPEKPAGMLNKAFSASYYEPPKRAAHSSNRSFWIVSGALAGAYIADETTTAGWIHRCPNCYEWGYFGHNSRNLPTIAAEQAAFDGSMLLVAYEWKKHIHNRVLNALWVLPPSLQIQNHIQAALHNQSLGRN